ncbi:hypothetical protein [Microcystis sp.]|uniref:hypothetical protein n=1 Tax=Microcystis sp. TaxID=1127 RepID=UPI003AF9F509
MTDQTRRLLPIIFIHVASRHIAMNSIIILHSFSGVRIIHLNFTNYDFRSPTRA